MRSACTIFVPPMKILVIDNYDSFVYNIVQLLRETSRTVNFDVTFNDQIDFDKLPEYNGLLLSPGPGIPSEAGNLLPLIRHCRQTHSILGICLGLQAIAESFGARLKHLDSPLHGHISRLRIADKHDPLTGDLPQPVVVGRYHSWVVDEASLPDCLQVGSYDEDGNIMSLYHKNLPIYGLQFHPESYMSNCGIGILEHWIDRIG